MLETERLYRVLKLSVLFSYFLYMLSVVLLGFLTNLLFMLKNTFLNTFIEMVDLFLYLALTTIKYTSIIFFILALIAIIVIFLHDWLIKPTQTKDSLF